MKAHIRVDAASGLMYMVVTTAAHIHDATQAHALLRGEKVQSGYLGAEKRQENKDKNVEWIIAVRHGKRRTLCESGTEKGRLADKVEQLKSQIHAKVVHPFYWIKVHFGHR